MALTVRSTTVKATGTQLMNTHPGSSSIACENDICRLLTFHVRAGVKALPVPKGVLLSIDSTAVDAPL